MSSNRVESGFDFASVIGKATELPQPTGSGGRDLPDGFPMPSGGHYRVVDSSKDPEGIDGVVAYDYTVKRRVFLIYRPWDNCDRCKQDISSEQVTLPPLGDHECPHTAKSDYEQIVNEILAGHFIFGSEQEVAQKDGSIVISLRWYEKKLNHKKMRQMRKNQSEDPAL